MINQAGMNKLILKIGRNSYFQFLVSFLFLTTAIIVDRGFLVFALPVPSGADPGNWLTFAKELTGAHIRLAEWSYPPLIPALLRLLLTMFKSEIALKILGLACWIFLACSFFVVLKLSFSKTPFYILLCVSLLFALASYHSEIFAFGGYPQILGLSFIILAIFFLNEWMAAGKGVNLFFTTLFTQLVFYSHPLMAVILIVMVILLFSWHLIFASGTRKELVRRMTWFFILNVLLFSLALPVYLHYYEYLAANPLNPSEFDFRSIHTLLKNVFRDSPVVWTCLVVVSVLAIGFNLSHKFSAIVVALMLGGVIAFLLTWEVRIFQVVITGICLGTALALYPLWNGNPIESKSNRLLKPLSTILIALVMIWVADSSRLTFEQSLGFYQVVDQPTYSGLVWAKENIPPGEIIGVSNWKPNLLGWWIEGFSGHPAIYATDLRWLVFARERYYAQKANRLFSNELPVEESQNMLKELKIKWLFVDKEYQWKNLQPLISEKVIVPRLDNERVLILQIK